MSNIYTISSRDGITFGVFHKSPRYEDIIQLIDETADNHPSSKRLWDLRNIEFDIAASELMKISDYSKAKFNMKIKLALLTFDDLSFGEMRQYGAFREEKDQFEIFVFRVEKEAIDWLNE